MCGQPLQVQHTHSFGSTIRIPFLFEGRKYFGLPLCSRNSRAAFNVPQVKSSAEPKSQIRLAERKWSEITYPMAQTAPQAQLTLQWDSKFGFFIVSVLGARTLLLEVWRASQADTSWHFLTKEPYLQLMIKIWEEITSLSLLEQDGW